jgi:hypothetical protein
MEAPRVVLEILSPLPLIDRRDGATVLDLWKAHLPEFLPDYIGNWEPIDRPFDRINLGSALENWKWPFLATSPKVNCGIWMRKNAHQQLHSTLMWDFEERLDAQNELLAFLKAIAAAVRADFACLHLLTKIEIERCRANRTVTALDKKATRFNFFLASKDLKRRIPDLYWATVLGAPYTAMFGKERVLSTPAYRVDAFSQDMVSLQMTKDLSDVDQHFDAFNEARQRALQHLGEKAFFCPATEAASEYWAPSFHFV